MAADVVPRDRDQRPPDQQPEVAQHQARRVEHAVRGALVAQQVEQRVEVVGQEGRHPGEQQGVRGADPAGRDPTQRRGHQRQLRGRGGERDRPRARHVVAQDAQRGEYHEGSGQRQPDGLASQHHVPPGCRRRGRLGRAYPGARRPHRLPAP